MPDLKPVMGDGWNEEVTELESDEIIAGDGIASAGSELAGVGAPTDGNSSPASLLKKFWRSAGTGTSLLSLGNGN